MLTNIIILIVLIVWGVLNIIFVNTSNDDLVLLNIIVSILFYILSLMSLILLIKNYNIKYFKIICIAILILFFIAYTISFNEIYKKNKGQNIEVFTIPYITLFVIIALNILKNSYNESKKKQIEYKNTLEDIKQERIDLANYQKEKIAKKNLKDMNMEYENSLF